MLNSLVIKNFRMLEDFTVEKLGRVNLIVGKNNSGKSTVLEALRIYAGNGDSELLKNIAENRDEVFKQNDSRFLYNELFTGREFPKSQYRDEGEYNLNHLYVPFPDTKDEEIFIAESNSETNSKKVYIWSTGHNFYTSRGEYEDAKIDGDHNMGYYLPVEPEETPCSFVPTQFIETDKLEREWNDINLTDNEEIVIQALQIIVPEFKRLAFDGDDKKRWVKVKLADLPKPVPLKSLGDGMLRILQIAIKLVSAQGGFLLIDEFENGLHYSVQENVWRLLFEMAEKLDIQVFATTHSWDCIESFITVAQQKPEADAVLFRMGKSVRKSNEGQVIATIFSGEELGYITQSNMEIR